MRRFDAAANLIADRAECHRSLPGRVVEVPVLVTFSGEDRAGVAATHGDHHVGGLDRLRR